MYYTAITLVILSGLVHSIWNLFTKKSINKVVFLWYCQLTAVFVFLPLMFIEVTKLELEISAIPLVGWLLIVASMVLHGLYIFLLAKAYTAGDLSQAYPIMRGISPLLVPIIGVLVLNEHLKIIGWAGVILIVLGIAIIGGFQSGKLFKSINNATLLAISVGIMITCYTVVDKLALQYVPPITLTEATNVGNVIVLSWIALRSNAIQIEWKMNWKTIILGGILAPGGYILFLMALQIMPVSQLAPMREIGIVFGTFFGILLLKEKQGKSRILASIFIALGIILLAQ